MDENVRTYMMNTYPTDVIPSVDEVSYTEEENRIIQSFTLTVNSIHEVNAILYRLSYRISAEYARMWTLFIDIGKYDVMPARDMVSSIAHEISPVLGDAFIKFKAHNYPGSEVILDILRSIECDIKTFLQVVTKDKMVLMRSTAPIVSPTDLPAFICYTLRRALDVLRDRAMTLYMITLATPNFVNTLKYPENPGRYEDGTILNITRIEKKVYEILTLREVVELCITPMTPMFPDKYGSDTIQMFGDYLKRYMT